MVLERQCTIAQAAENLGIKHATLSYWVRQHEKRNGSVNASEEKNDFASGWRSWSARISG